MTNQLEFTEAVTVQTANQIKLFIEVVLAGGAPVLAFVGALSIGILLQLWPKFKNAWVPVAEILFSSVIMAVLGDAIIPDTFGASAFQRYFAASVLGLAIGVGSWMFRKVALGRILKSKMFNGHKFDSDPPFKIDPPASDPLSRGGMPKDTPP